mgnify:CR=1 FL=1
MTRTQPAEGHDSRHCGARRKQGTGTCTRPAGWGTDHPGIGPCKLHGGSTPNHTNAARTERARRAVATYGLPRDIDPAKALLEEVHRTAGHVAWLAAKIAESDEDSLVWGPAEETEKSATPVPGTDTKHAARPNVWLDLYQRERTHLVRVSKAALDAGINERLVKLAEQQGTMLAEIIRRSAEALLAETTALLDDEPAAQVRRAWPGWIARIVPAQIAAVTEDGP